MGNFGIRELVVVLLVVLVIFGTKKLGSIGADLGRAVKGFKSAMSEGEREQEESTAAPKQLGPKDAEFAESKKTETSAKT
jgi:sec-independent protein translocase protein TatA